MPHRQAGHRPRRQLGPQRLDQTGGPQPWPQWSQGPRGRRHADPERPGPGHVSMSGGWLLSVGSHATRQADGLQLHHHRPGQAELAVLRHRRRPDRRPARRGRGPGVQAAKPVGRRRSPASFPSPTSVPAFAVYPKLSNEIQVITGQVMTGQPPRLRALPPTTSTSSQLSGRATSKHAGVSTSAITGA